MAKGDVIELQQPIEGERSPGGVEDVMHGESPQDSADMDRLGRKQQLQVRKDLQDAGDGHERHADRI